MNSYCRWDSLEVKILIPEGCHYHHVKRVEKDISEQVHSLKETKIEHFDMIHPNGYIMSGRHPARHNQAYHEHPTVNNVSILTTVLA